MPVIMEPQLIEEPSNICVKEESNNNIGSNGHKKSVFDDLDETNQEINLKPYYLSNDIDDEFDNSNASNEDYLKEKRISTSTQQAKRNSENLLDKEGEPNDSQILDENYHNGDLSSGYQVEFNYCDNENPKHNNEQDRYQHSIEPEQFRKLFIGGLDYKTSEATLKLHFEKFGEVLDCVVLRDTQSKRSRGFGFVIYAKSSMVDRAQEARPHEVDGREVQSKRAWQREDSGKPEMQATVKKVYLGGLSDDIEESELREYFKDFGTIVNVNIVAHKDTGKRRGFAFVEFDDYDPVDKIVMQKFHSIKDKRIEAKKAIPKVEMDARKRGDTRASIAGTMIALAGPIDGSGGRSRPSRNSSCLWEGGPYSAGGYPPGYSSQTSLDGFPPHYHTHYGANNWMIHSSQGGYGFRGAHGSAYGRNGYPNQAGSWTTVNDYAGFPPSQGGGGTGPMRLSYQHRGWGPYGSGYGAHRGRGYNS